MDAQLAEGVGLVALRFHEGSRVVPVPGGLESTASGCLDKGAAIRLVHTDIGIHKVAACHVEGIDRRLHSLRLIPVIAVDDTDDVTGGIADALFMAS